MIQIVAFIGLVTFCILFLSSLYHNARGEFQPGWWYAVVAVCAVCQFIFAFLIREEHPILAIMLFAGTSGLSYVTCRMAILHDRIRKR